MLDSPNSPEVAAKLGGGIGWRCGASRLPLLNAFLLIVGLSQPVGWGSIQDAPFGWTSSITNASPGRPASGYFSEHELGFQALTQSTNSQNLSSTANKALASLPPQSTVPRSAEHKLDSSVGGRDKMVSSPLASPTSLPDRTMVEPRAASSMPNEELHWWDSLLTTSILEGDRTTQAIDPDQLVYTALQNSPQIQAISCEPEIRVQQVQEACAAFDPELFAQTLYDDRVDPVGNLLTTGGLPFLEDNIWTGTAGLRRKLPTGANVELSEKLGFHNSNSRFFSPQDQGTATLLIDLNQPLLGGAGRSYNRSQIVLAQTVATAAWETYSADLQTELVKVVEAYWNLAYRCAVLLQKRRNVRRGLEVLDKLKGRRELDSVPSQILRAEATVKSRQAELANTFREVEDAQVEIHRLTGELNVAELSAVELIPMETPEFVPSRARSRSWLRSLWAIVRKSAKLSRRRSRRRSNTTFPRTSCCRN